MNCYHYILLVLAIGSLNNKTTAHYVTHGHLDAATGGTHVIDVCHPFPQGCCNVKVDDLYFVWSHKSEVGRLYIEHIRDGRTTRVRLEQETPSDEEEVWRRLTPALLKKISMSSNVNTRVRDFVLTRVKLDHLVLGIQTLWFVDRKKQTPTIINCVEENGQRKCQWVSDALYRI